MNAHVKITRIPKHPVDPQFIGRWSPRAFDGSAMTEADVLTLIEAARWAPSANNNQPWRMVWSLQGTPEFAAIAGTLAGFNIHWAGKAAALIVIASKATVLRDGAEVPNAYAGFDTGAAWAQLGLQAHLNGFVAHAMGGFDHEALGAAIHLPEGHQLHAVVAVGRHGDPATLPEALQAREVYSGRHALDDVAKRGRF